MRQGENSTILSTFIKLPFVFKTFVLPILSGRLRQILLYTKSFIALEPGLAECVNITQYIFLQYCNLTMKFRTNMIFGLYLFAFWDIVHDFLCRFFFKFIEFANNDVFKN